MQYRVEFTVNSVSMVDLLDSVSRMVTSVTNNVTNIEISEWE